jgi:hypothetical protein
MSAFMRLFRAGLEEVEERLADLVRLLARLIGPPLRWLLLGAIWLALWVLEFPILVLQGLWIVVVETGRRLRRASERAAAAVHPGPVVGLVILGAIALLAASQFGDYRGEAVGDYTPPGLAEVGVDPPLSDRRTPIDVHSYALLALAAVALAALVVATAGRRWRLGRVVSLSGLAALGVVLIVDLRDGLEVGREALAYTDANASLLGPFWVELTAAATLTLCGALLSAYLRPAVERRERRRPERQRRSRSRLGRRRRATGLAEGHT